MKPELEAVMSNFSYGLYVLTVEADGWPMAMVVSWVSQICYEPPLLSVAVRENRYACDLIKEKKAFALFVMAPDEIGSMTEFKNKDAKARLADLNVSKGLTGAPIIDFGLGYVECSLEEVISKGDHTVFIGRIVDGKPYKDGKPATTLDYGKVYLGKS